MTDFVDIPFTQYLRPDGRRRYTTIDRPSHVAAKAAEILAAGFRFECEEMMSGQVSLTIGDDDGDYAIEVVPNGPAVPDAVDRLILKFDPSAVKKDP